jgi:lysophospholipase L1-like esterase
MTVAGTQRRSALVYASAFAAVASVWWFTALEDSEWALWRRYSAGMIFVNLAASALIFSAAYLACGWTDFRRRAGNVALMGGSFLFVVGLLELPAVLAGYDYGRTFGTAENDTWLQLAMGVNRPDRELLHIHNGHTRYQGVVHGNLKRLGIPTASYAVDVAYDGNGFRNNRDFTRADIVAIGDSFVEGAEVQHSETMVAQLGRQLDADVVNLGQSNYGPQQELVVLKRYAVPLKPKAVVWFFFGGNDLDDVVSYEERRSHYDELLAPPSLAARSFTRNALRAAAALTTPPRGAPSPDGRLHAAVFTRRNGTKETLYLDAEEGPWTPRQWEATAVILSDAYDQTRRLGADFLLVFIPRKLRVYRGFVKAEAGAHALIWQDNNLPDVLGAWCRDQGIAFLDSTHALRAAAAAGESVYLPDDVHWNPAGHRVVATAVSEHLRQMGSLLTDRQDHSE